MTTIDVQLGSGSRSFSFSCDDPTVQVGDQVICRTQYGMKQGTVVAVDTDGSAWESAWRLAVPRDE